MQECKDIILRNSAGQPHGYWELNNFNCTLVYKKFYNKN